METVMNMNDLPFNQLDVTARINPPHPLIPVPFNAWAHIGQTVLLDPRRARFMPSQPRNTFKGIKGFATSIKENGQKTSILVFPVSDDPDYDVELIAGERRTRSCRRSGNMIRAEIRPVPANEDEQYIDAAVENFCREDLTLVETIEVVRLLAKKGKSQRQIAAMLNKTYAWVVQYSSLSTLNPAVLLLLENQDHEQRTENGRKLRRKSLISMTIALEVAKIEPAAQLDFAQMLIDEQVPENAARVMVRHRVAERNQTRPRRTRPDKERLDIFTRESQNFELVLVQHLQQAIPELRRTMHSHGGERIGNLVRRLRAIAGEAAELADKIDPNDAKRYGSTTAWHPALQTWLNQKTQHTSNE